MTKIDSFNVPREICLSEKPFIASSASISNSFLGKYSEVGNFTQMENVTMDDYSYVSEYCQIDNSEIGKFANIASHVRINPGFHPPP